MSKPRGRTVREAPLYEAAFHTLGVPILEVIQFQLRQEMSEGGELRLLRNSPPMDYSPPTC